MAKTSNPLHSLNVAAKCAPETTHVAWAMMPSSRLHGDRAASGQTLFATGLKSSQPTLFLQLGSQCRPASPPTLTLNPKP